MTEKTKTKIDLEMPCTCSDEGKEDALLLRALVRDSLGITVENDFTSNVIASLWHDYMCTINGIYMDMWFGIAAENETETFFLTCDSVEDGLATIWKHHKDKN